MIIIKKKKKTLYVPHLDKCAVRGQGLFACIIRTNNAFLRGGVYSSENSSDANV